MDHLSLIYRQQGVWLSKRQLSWQQWQEFYPDYISSLDNWPCEDLIAFLQEEYPNLSPDAQNQVLAALNTPDDYQLLFVTEAN
jgi:hypothetical protein